MIHLKLTFMALLWAGGFVAAKNVVDYAGPFTLSFTRFFVATTIMAAIVLTKKQSVRLNGSLLGYAVCAAFLGMFCYNYFFFSGIKHVEAGRGSVILATVPIVVTILSYSFLNEKVSALKAVGITLSFLGAWIVISKGAVWSVLTQTVGRGEIYLIACALCAGTFTLFSKQMLNQLSPMVTMVTISAVGTAFLSVPAWMEMSRFPVQVDSVSFVLNLLYLSVGPSVIAVTFYYEAIQKVGAARASQYMNLIPVFAVVLAFVFLGEQITGSLLVGGGLVTTGLYLNNFST